MPEWRPAVSRSSIRVAGACLRDVKTTVVRTPFRKPAEGGSGQGHPAAGRATWSPMATCFDSRTRSRFPATATIAGTPPGNPVAGPA